MTKLVKISSPAKIRTGKRREVSRSECLVDLKKDLPKIFKAFNKGVKLFNKTMEDIPFNSRIRLDAPLLNSRIVQCIQEEFPEHWKFGRYKRFVLRIEDYLVLFKKLDRKNKPMNIQTKHVNSISNQMQLSLFNDSSFFTEPILFFGYKKDKSGEIISPQLVYIDEDMVKWVISENDIEVINTGNSVSDISRKRTINLSIKEELRSKKASNN
ncbi:hypothetical protein [uncultured Algibacter sp.]|uniref:hypothetical protein n=1 Tax=uncultured Algibacter sp. TaxID=298659 RepID=UPI002639E386|nr:hypothetical protein [uncultured Algibacter sp.]